jgi:hypothetical protein
MAVKVDSAGPGLSLFLFDSLLHDFHGIGGRIMNQSALQIVRVVVAAVAVLAGSAEAQIVNTLRGFDAEDSGWSGSVAGAVAFAEGNTQYFEFEIDGKVQYQTSRHRWRLIGIHMRRTARGVEVAEARLGHFRHNYRLWSRFSTIAFLQGQYNPFLRIDSRTVIGGGGRAELFEGDVWRSAIGVTVMHETEELTDENDAVAAFQSVERTSNYRVSSFLTVYREGANGFDIDLWAFFQPVMNDFADARASGAASIGLNIVGELDLVVTYVVKYDSQPPSGVKKYDYILRSGLGWKF